MHPRISKILDIPFSYFSNTVMTSGGETVYHAEKEKRTHPAPQSLCRYATLLLDLRSIDIGGAQEKEGHFHYKNFESFEMRYLMPYLLHHPKIP